MRLFRAPGEDLIPWEMPNNFTRLNDQSRHFQYTQVHTFMNIQFRFFWGFSLPQIVD